MLLEAIYTDDRIAKQFHVVDSQIIMRASNLAQVYAAIKNYNICSAIGVPTSEVEDVKAAIGKVLGCEFNPDYTVEASRKSEQMGWVFIPNDTSVLFIATYGKRSHLGVTVYSSSQEEIDLYHKKFTENFPAPTIKKKPTEIPFKFWSYSPDGAVSRRRNVNALDWEEVSRNYPKAVLENVNPLFDLRPPIEAGKIILWHGPPGTGKSSCIRSIAQAWMPWCDTSFVVDPERFFNVSEYMLEVCLDTPTEEYFWDDEDDEEDDEDPLEGEKRWRLLIVEDADEFIQADAKDRTGQALSRLLNLGDGLIGSGLNFLTLITTNEKLDNVHKAVSRPGRCLANIHFDMFTQHEAEIWWETQFQTPFLPKKKKDTYSLAELYDLTRQEEKQQIATEKQEEAHGVYL